MVHNFVLFYDFLKYSRIKEGQHFVTFFTRALHIFFSCLPQASWFSLSSPFGPLRVRLFCLPLRCRCFPEFCPWVSLLLSVYGVSWVISCIQFPLPSRNSSLVQTILTCRTMIPFLLSGQFCLDDPQEMTSQHAPNGVHCLHPALHLPLLLYSLL